MDVTCACCGVELVEGDDYYAVMWKDWNPQLYLCLICADEHLRPSPRPLLLLSTV